MFFRRLLNLRPHENDFTHKYAVSYRDDDGEGDTEIFSNSPLSISEIEETLIEQLNASEIYPQWLQVTNLIQLKPLKH
ncbi:hypothetical protein [Kamptonema sp. UHCC 0994]|uniref:hypothetical protein n=1 Tax=Kamptonema sp. UHCC 0994 TaxID=3031329 RepID=UPI0023BB0F5C|nr:hypothetical protein [Kamptonema sp. UHCC 0994]MDF0556571.1 hypothetical protein [Kamptonema sp. UHCC 0994]